jgi:hypothetical protein
MTAAAPVHQLPIFVRVGAALELGDLNQEWQDAQAAAAVRPDLASLEQTVNAWFAENGDTESTGDRLDRNPANNRHQSRAHARPPPALPCPETRPRLRAAAGPRDTGPDADHGNGAGRDGRIHRTVAG